MRNGTPVVIVFKVDNKNHKAKLHRFKAAFQGQKKFDAIFAHLLNV